MGRNGPVGGCGHSPQNASLSEKVTDRPWRLGFFSNDCITKNVYVYVGKNTSAKWKNNKTVSTISWKKILATDKVGEGVSTAMYRELLRIDVKNVKRKKKNRERT